MTTSPQQQMIPLNRSSVEDRLVALVRDFQSGWQDFFCEEELHAHFYHLCRDQFPRYPTYDRIVVPAFHHRFETFWRYADGDRFAERQLFHGEYATFDFVVLRDAYFQHNNYANALQIHQARYAGGNLGVLVATPPRTFLGGDWADEVEFPNVASQGGWPVG